MESESPLRVLFVGRSASTREQLQALLESSVRAGDSPTLRSLEFHAVTNQKGALNLIRTKPPTILLVEVDSRPNSRVRFCEMVRYRLPTATIVALAQAQQQTPKDFDRVLHLPLKRLEIDALLCEIRNEPGGYQMVQGPIQLNIATRTVVTPNGRHRITPKQCALLQYLMARHDEVVPRSEIMACIWQTSYLEDTRTLDVHVRWLREYIEPDPSSPVYLETIRGIGYRLNSA